MKRSRPTQRTAEPKSARNLLDAVGRLMHHIQDMSMPSHVVPVYHGPGLADQYEEYGKAYARRLSVHTGKESDNHLMLSVTEEAVMQAAKRLQGAHSPLFNLYVSAAEATLEKLRTETLEIHLDGMAQRRTWNAFWRECTGADAQCPNGCGNMENLAEGFGSFGPLCNNFGRIHFETAEGFCEIASDQYLELFKELFRKSVIDSLLILRHIAQRCGVLTCDHRLVHVD